MLRFYHLTKKIELNWYYAGVHQAFIIRADCEEKARRLAHLAAQEDMYPNGLRGAELAPWLDPNMTDCDVLIAREGPQMIIMSEYSE